ncbi:MAG: hypothetical protein AAB857_04030 [Patescibacteria group bacterium]
MLMVRRLAIAFLVLFVLVASILLRLSFLSDEETDRGIILVATNFGTETTTHADFVDKLIWNTKLHQKATLKIFLGSYVLLMGRKGFLVKAPPNYYIFIDMYFYYSLNQNEKEALIAHEFGHIVYEYNLIDKLQFKILYKFDPLGKRRNEILTKYQIRADGFSAENTSPAAVISLLNKLYLIDSEDPDHKMRIKSLNRLKQGH